MKMHSWKPVFLGSLLLSTLLPSGLQAADENKATVTQPSAALTLARQLNDAFIEVAEKVSPAVVVVKITQKASTDADEGFNPFDFIPQDPQERRPQRPGQGQGQGRGNRQQQQQPAPRQPKPSEGRGSGMVMTEDGYILTNNHVVEDADTIVVRFKDHTEYPAEVRGRDPESDLAIIKIKASGLKTVKFADSAATRVGEFAVAIGAPFDLDYSVTYGHVSAKGRSFEGMMMSGYVDQDFIQTDASINPGNSGGPLVNLYGEVIGVNAMIRGLNTGIGFAIPSNLAKVVSDHLIKDGKFTRSFLGVHIKELNEDQDLSAIFAPLKQGVIIYSIVPTGPAAKSDLKPSDVVIAVDGKQVRTTRELKEQIAIKPVGATVVLDVRRFDRDNKSKTLNIKVKTEGLPSTDLASNTKTKEKPKVAEDVSSFGITVQPLNKENADKYDVDPGKGVIVVAVEQDSLAETRGIKPGDVITEVNSIPTTSPKAFKDATKNADLEKGVRINIISSGASELIVLRDRSK
ncbi:MAG: hypothetical protein JWN25_1989 [Verrucomicrobiales bacterium]|nr:hypothetical protein [Verrucomicrobiales bacterium]